MAEPTPFIFPWEPIMSPMPEEFKKKFSIGTTLGDIITKLLPFVFSGAGIALFIYLLFGGFQFLTSGGDPKAVEGAKSKITNALIGFAIIFVAFLLIKVLENILGIPSPVEAPVEQ